MDGHQCSEIAVNNIVNSQLSLSKDQYAFFMVRYCIPVMLVIVTCTDWSKKVYRRTFPNTFNSAKSLE